MTAGRRSFVAVLCLHCVARSDAVTESLQSCFATYFAKATKVKEGFAGHCFTPRAARSFAVRALLLAKSACTAKLKAPYKYGAFSEAVEVGGIEPPSKEKQYACIYEA